MTTSGDLAAELTATRRELDAVRTELALAIDSYKAFAYSVSHDLRAPLRAIAGFASMLEESLPDQLTDDARSLFAMIRDNVHVLSAQIDGLLVLSRLEHRELRPCLVDMTSVAQAVVDRMRQTEPTHAVAVTVAALAPVNGDVDMLQTALLELVKNAWKFTKRRSAPMVLIDSERRQGDVVYRVRDNGVGLSGSTDGLFTVFRRLHGRNDYDGLGIGLATVKTIVTRHRGTVWIEPAPEGATFAFSLPA